MKRIRKINLEWHRAWRKKNRDKLLAKARSYGAKPEVIEKRRQYDRKTYENRKNVLFKRKYGITHQDYINMNAAQNGVCAICKKTCTCGRSLAVDHNHKTGKVRALLCSRCNRGLGLFMENPEYLNAAKEYLLHHDGQFSVGGERFLPYFEVK